MIEGGAEAIEEGGGLIAKLDIKVEAEGAGTIAEG